MDNATTWVDGGARSSAIAVALLIAALLVIAPGAAIAHDRLGANLNGIADYRRNHEFADVVRQSRRFLRIGSYDDADPANLVPIGADGWPTTDFRLLAMADQADTRGLAGTYRIVFRGRANLSTGPGAGTIRNRTFDPGTGTTRAELEFPAGGDLMIVDFADTGGGVRDLRVIRPGLDADRPPLLRPEWAAHAGRFPVLRFMDWTRTNGNRQATWAERTTPAKQRTEAAVASWETVIATANALRRDAWINVPVRADDDYVRQLAMLLRDGLDPALNVWVEYGNELWNFGLRDVGLDALHGGDPFNGATVNRELAAASAPDSPLRYDGETDPTTLGFRRVALRLREISAIFREVWGAAAINTRVRPVLAGQMANPYVVAEGLRLVDQGLGIRPDTVFYAIAGAPYVFAAAMPDGEADETPELSRQQILDGMAAGVAHAPDAGAYQYLAHAGLAAWYGLKVVAYEAGFDSYGGGNVAAKRAANLDPAIRTLCGRLFDDWHRHGFEQLLWFNAGADRYDTPFGMWPLVEDLAQPAVPKNLCIDDVLAAALPPLSVGIPVDGSPVAGGNFQGSANPTGALTGRAAEFGYPGHVEYLLRVPAAGVHTLVFRGQAPAGESFRVRLNNTTVAERVGLPVTGGSSAVLSVTLRQGLNALRIERGVGVGFSVTDFTPTAVGGTAPGTAERTLATHYYRSILRREPDAAGLAYWEAMATTLPGWGASRDETWYAMAVTFFASAEYRTFARDDTGFVTDLYQTFFNRAPDTGGLAYWVGALGRGVPREVVLAGFLFSHEFASFTTALFGTAGARPEVDLVMDFYRGLLARLPDRGGFDAWLQQLRSAQCSGTAAVTSVVDAISRQFLESPEYLGRGRGSGEYVGDLYNAFLRRGGDEAGVAFWIRQLATGAGSRETLRQAFRDSAEFRGRVAAVVVAGCLP